ncbi:uncharacterized protein LOC144442609 [Glandiceps talaboti]
MLKSGSGKFLKRSELSRRLKVKEATVKRWRVQSVSGDYPNRPLDPDSIASSTNVTNADKDKLTTTTTKDVPWNEGVRVVNLGVLAQELDSCKVCRNHLRLIKCTGETKYGGGSVLHVECHNCGANNNVYTNKTHRNVGQKRGMAAFDINTKIATGMINAGIGETHVNTMFSSMSLPTMHNRTLKRKEKLAGEAITHVAKRSCQQALRDEVMSSKKPRIDVSYDGGWQKRGSGRDYKSLSGHGTLLGRETGKVLAYSTRCKQCRVCESARDGAKVRQHNCHRNWSGSAKAMEASIAVETVKEVEEVVKIDSVTMDDDSTTIAKLHAEVRPDIVKNKDNNHTKKGFANKLYKLKEQKGYCQLSTKVINYLQKCFNYAVTQNHGNPEGLKKNLQAIMPHSFGDHMKCDRKWCRYPTDPNSYKHKSLPYGKDLSGSDLREDLEKVMNTYLATAKELARIGSSQGNESMNMVIASKAPKAKHYSGSTSFNYRVAAAVAQKNLGHTYVSQVCNVSQGCSSIIIQDIKKGFYL